MAEITLEQVELLRQKVPVSYEDAKVALVATGGNLLDAVIYLERQGKSEHTPGGFYSTRGGGSTAEPSTSTPLAVRQPKVHHKNKDGKDASDIFKELFDAAWSVLRRSTINHLDIWWRGELLVALPVLIIVVFLLFFWVTIPIAAVGLVCGLRYRFSGPDLGKEGVNKVMDQVSDAVGTIVEKVKQEFSDKKK